MKLIGVDVGGTFTDLVFADTDSKETAIRKVATTPHDPSEGVVHVTSASRIGLFDFGVNRRRVERVRRRLERSAPGDTP